MTDPNAHVGGPATASAQPDAEITARLKIALRAAEAAGGILMRHLGKLEAIEKKAAVDLVTVADRESEACVLTELRLAFPGDVVIGEESDGADGRAALQARANGARYAWLVDPLDGTTNFAHGYLQFCVSIGLLRDGVPVLGVVHAPARRETYVGGEGVHATCNGERIAVSRVASLEDALVATGFPYDRRSRLDLILARLRAALLQVQGVRRGGSAAMDLCEVAAGRLDAYWEDGLQPWDLAAGVAIVRAAGGEVSGWAGDGTWHPFAGLALAGNATIRAQMQGLLQASDAAFTAAAATVSTHAAEANR